MAHKQLWHAMKNIGAINSRPQKLMASQKIMDCHENCDTFLPNGMLCHYHMEDQVVINCKGQQYFELANKQD
jgi:hypothetical protein